VSATTGVRAEPTTENDVAPDDPVSPVIAPDPDDSDSSAASRDDAEAATSAAGSPSASGRRRIGWSRVLALGVLPAVVLLFTVAAGYFKWSGQTARESESPRVAAVRAATESTVALLSYKPDSVDKDLNAARDRLTGTFKDAYTSLIHDVVIPGAKQKQISALATVAAAGAVSATENHAVVLVFVDQIVNVGNDPPTDTASVVRVTLDRQGDRWLISQFEPI
jgi:Mce-associated membrane protein